MSGARIRAPLFALHLLLFDVLVDEAFQLGRCWGALPSLGEQTGKLFDLRISNYNAIRTVCLRRIEEVVGEEDKQCERQKMDKWLA